MKWMRRETKQLEAVAATAIVIIITTTTERTKVHAEINVYEL